jgi:hypothetical protein
VGAVCYIRACSIQFDNFVAQTEADLRNKLKALFETMADRVSPAFYGDLMKAARKSDKSPEEVLTTALELYRATLLRPDSKERLRVFAAQFHALVTKEANERMTPEERAKRASLGGQALAELWTDEEKRARASLGGYARAQKFTPEQRRQQALALVEARRRKREAREREQAGSPSKRSSGSTKRSRS